MQGPRVGVRDPFAALNMDVLTGDEARRIALGMAASRNGCLAECPMFVDQFSVVIEVSRDADGVEPLAWLNSGKLANGCLRCVRVSAAGATAILSNGTHRLRLYVPGSR